MAIILRRSKLTAIVDYGRKLIAQTLPKRRGCLEEHILSVKGGNYDFSLKWSTKMSVICTCKWSKSETDRKFALPNVRRNVNSISICLVFAFEAGIAIGLLR